MSRAGRYYPPPGGGRRRTLVGDVVAILLVVAFAWIGFKVHDAIAGLAEITRGVTSAGTSIRETGQDAGGELRGGFDAAADAIGAAPVVGGPAAEQLRGAGDRAAGAIERQARLNGTELEQAGQDGTDDILSLATLMGWLSFLVPTLLLLSQALPTRLRQVRALRPPERAPPRP